MEERDRLAGNNKRRRDRILQGIRKHPWIAALAVICLLLFLFPPIVCMELRVNYTDMEYEKGAKLEVLTSPWEDRILPSGLQVTCARRGQSRIRFLDPTDDGRKEHGGGAYIEGDRLILAGFQLIQFQPGIVKGSKDLFHITEEDRGGVVQADSFPLAVEQRTAKLGFQTFQGLA